MPNKPPEKSLIKGQYHKRMQSLQNSNHNVRDISNYLENPRSPERSPERSSRSTFEHENRSSDRSPTRPRTPTPIGRELGKDIPNLRATRPLLKAILGENTPQSATMLALQETATSKDLDNPLSNITNGSTALVRTPHSFEHISTQILSLTGIATNLQREMAHLSRRSKDNATDLISLKEATSTRDEDIRKSLRDLVSNLQSQASNDHGHWSSSPYMRSAASCLLDDKAHHTSALAVPKNITLPRIPSPTSFAATIEREISGSPLPYSTDGAANIALLEKILREMGTKEGQERLVSSLSELRNRPITNGIDSTTATKLEQILDFIKENSNDRAMVTRSDDDDGTGDRPPRLELDLDDSAPMPVARSSRIMTPYGINNIVPADNNKSSNSKTSGFISDDILKLLKKMKDSITEGGGLSGEIKALVRELRGEVLGMGREIGRRLDQAESVNSADSKDHVQSPGREEIATIVEDGLARLREHMDRVIHENSRRSSSTAMSRSNVDIQEIFLAMKNALKEMPLQQQAAVQQPGPGIEREEILEAVREAWETYKPEIELQNFGLERDEILQCLKEGLYEYKLQNESKEISGATYEEVLEAVREGVKGFNLPQHVDSESSITKDEILLTVRECLESSEFWNTTMDRGKGSEITREDVLDAVKEGLSAQAPVTREIDFNRDDLFDAVKAGLESVPAPMAGLGEQILEKMQELIGGMKGEFKQYSAANGRDTEQVLDAMKDGLEVLRAGIETYVDRAADVTGKDEIIETVRGGLEHLRIDLEGTIASFQHNTGGSDNGELLDAMEKEFEHLRQTLATSMVHSDRSSIDKDEILDAIRDGMDEVKREIPHGGSQLSSETMSMLKEEFEHLRKTLATSVTGGESNADRDEIMDIIRSSFEELQSGVGTAKSKPESILSNTGELLDAFNDGLDGLKVNIEKIVNKPLDMTVNYEILDTLKEGLSGVRADIDRLHAAQFEQESLTGRRGGQIVVADIEPKCLGRTDVENLEIMITQLKMKMESLDNIVPPFAPASQAGEAGLTRVDFERLESMMKDIHLNVALLNERERGSDNVVTKEDTDAIETLLRNTKATIDEIVSPTFEGLARTEHLDSVEATLRNTRDVVDDIATRQEVETATKSDINMLQGLLKEVRASCEDIYEKSGVDGLGARINRTDIEVLETLCMDTKTHVERMVLPDPGQLPTKVDVETLATLVEGFQNKVEADAELTAQAFEARKIEHGGIADKIEDVKIFLDDVRQELKSRIEGNGQGVENLTTTLNALNDSFKASDATTSITEMVGVMTREFELLHNTYEATKLETDQHREILLAKHDGLRCTILTDLAAKIESRFDELMLKYDDAHIAANTSASGLNERDYQQSEAFCASRNIAEDLKVLVETLGSSITETCGRVGEDSKTIYNRVDDVAAKLDESTNIVMTENKAIHQTTKAEISKTLAAVEGLQAQAGEYHPKIMKVIDEIMVIVRQQYELAQRSTEELKNTVNAIPSAILMPAITAPLTSPLLERELQPTERYDNSEIHAKLDMLVAHVMENGRLGAQNELLKQVKAQAEVATVELSTLLRAQQAAISGISESHPREADGTVIALEKRIAQKDQVEADIVRLSDDKIDLANSIVGLRLEEHELTAQKSKLQADLSSLETALQIRREEMHLMEARAEGLERRILEGVLDHSRSLLINSKSHASLKVMNLKRVTSTASDAPTIAGTTPGSVTNPSSTGAAVIRGLDMALKQRQPLRSAGSAITNKGDRRILSLSTINTNRGPTVERSLVLANPSFTGLGPGKGKSVLGAEGLKRSHSVKSNFPVRKTSWGGTRQVGLYGDAVEEDKENSILDEEDEEGSDGGTERRTSCGTEADRMTSYSGTYTATGSYGTDSMYGDIDRRTSYGASTVGTVGRKLEAAERASELSQDSSNGSQASQSEGESADRHIMLYQGNMEGHKSIGSPRDVAIFGLPSDSGIGTDLPTAGLEGGSDYFRKE